MYYVQVYSCFTGQLIRETPFKTIDEALVEMSKLDGYALRTWLVERGETP